MFPRAGTRWNDQERAARHEPDHRRVQGARGGSDQARAVCSAGWAQMHAWGSAVAIRVDNDNVVSSCG